MPINAPYDARLEENSVDSKAVKGHDPLANRVPNHILRRGARRFAWHSRG
jgi:hypothetical protein